MALWQVSQLRLADVRFEITRADGGIVDFSDLVTGMTITEDVRTAATECQVVAHGPVDQVVRIGGEGSTLRVVGPSVDISSGIPTEGLGELWRGYIETVVDQRPRMGSIGT